MNKKQQNIYVYNKSARSLVNKFDNLGGYPKEIKKVFSLIPKKIQKSWK